MECFTQIKSYMYFIEKINDNNMPHDVGTLLKE